MNKLLALTASLLLSFGLCFAQEKEMEIETIKLDENFYCINDQIHDSSSLWEQKR